MLKSRGRLVWRVLFGVVMAGLLMGIFLAYTATQREYATGEEAQSLADHLSRTAFSAATREQPTYDLPKAVGESGYELDVENNTFIVRITGGAQKGKEYRSTVGIDLEVLSLPEPDNTLYAQGRADKIIISSSPIGAPEEELISPATFEPPAFYDFAKNNPREASAIITSYCYARQKYPDEENLDIQSYKWKSSDVLASRVTSGGDFLVTIRASGYENAEDIGYINKAWIVAQLETSEEDLSNPASCPSVGEAYSSDWLYPRKKVVAHLLGRTWRRKEDNKIVAVPENLTPKAAAVTTNVSTYPTWRFEFESGNEQYVLHFAAMPWNPSENMAGFVFESKPDLEAGA